MARAELEEREKVREELHGVQVWLEAADGLLSETEQSSSPQDFQVGRSSKLIRKVETGSKKQQQS